MRCSPMPCSLRSAPRVCAAGQSDEEGEGRQKLLQNNPMWFKLS